MSQKYQTSLEHQEINLAMKSLIFLVILVCLTIGQGYGDGEYSQMKHACNCKDSTLPGIDCATLSVECANSSISYLCPVTCHSKPTCCL